MSILLTVSRLLGAALICYIIVISLRILVSWFGNSMHLKFYALLCRLADPYLSLFRNIRFLKTPSFDYSPLFGIGILIVAANILMQIAFTGMITLSGILTIVLNMISATVLWILLFFTGLCAARFLGIHLHKAQGHIAWSYIDSILQPALLPVLRFLNKKPDYKKLLLAGILFFIIILIAGFIVVNLLFYAIRIIPF